MSRTKASAEYVSASNTFEGFPSDVVGVHRWTIGADTNNMATPRPWKSDLNGLWLSTAPSKACEIGDLGKKGTWVVSGIRRSVCEPIVSKDVLGCALAALEQEDWE